MIIEKSLIDNSNENDCLINYIVTCNVSLILKLDLIYQDYINPQDKTPW